jgi:hypothetical protein
VESMGSGLTGIGFTSVAINRVKRLSPNLLATGDDDGVVKVTAFSVGYDRRINAFTAVGSQET